jgi:hypothetical protein
LGQAGVFLYIDPDDNTVVGQSIGTGNGATQSFVMGRTLGGFNEPVAWVTGIANVYLNGALQSPSTWLFTAPNSLGFYTAPGAGVAISGDFSYAFQCRFLDDQMDFEEFMSSLWRLDAMKFRSVKANTTPAAPPSWYNQYAINGALPTLFADACTEGGANHYYYNGNTCGSFAALLTALGVTFSRTSSASYYNSSGVLTIASANVLRFDYNPATLAPSGLLVEGPSTNLLLHSGDLTNAATFGGNVNGVAVSVSSVKASDGATDYTKILASAGLSQHECQAGPFTVSSGATVTLSFELTYGNQQYVGLALYYGSWHLCAFDIQNGLTGAASAGYTSSLINLGGGRYRCSITATIAGTSVYAGLFLVNGNSTSTAGFTAAGTEYTYAIFSQLEVQQFATSYIPTTSSSASRAADNLSAATWPAITAGTVYVKADTLYGALTQRLIQIDDGTAANRASLSFNGSAAGEFDFLAGGASEASLTAGSIAANTPAQLAAAFQANDFALVGNGGSPSASASGGVPPFSRLRVGQDAANANNLFGHIAQIGVWNNLRGPNASLQNIT